MQRITQWDRPFQAWSYAVSHSRLLLRSVNTEGSNTRIDALLSNVEMMHLSPDMERLAIDEGDFSEVGSLTHQPSHRPRGKVFIINDGESYISATHCQWHEDEGGPRSPSKFGPLLGFPGYPETD
ncbi:hypothetical protein [Streptomyces cellulosae]|uniref:Uncharacterized protein n=1 Tax=Streptomyces cellulosae TaxID=1968 RepID=A0ABW7Y8S9_STRCE